MDSYVIYLGGSITQSSNLSYLKNKKYKIILIDQNQNCYCRKYSDFFFKCSQLDTKKILLILEKFFYNKKFNIVECFGVAHYSYPSVNEIKKKYVQNYVDDYFLMHKTTQKKQTKKNPLSPNSMILGNYKETMNKSENYWVKIYKFYQNNNYNIYFKSDGKHQGIGVHKISGKISMTDFIEKKKIKLLNLLKENRGSSYLEQTVNGRLLNLDYIKKKNNKVIFLPLIYRDKVTFKDKRKFLSIFQYCDNSDIINKKDYREIANIIKKNFKNVPSFGTLDLVVNDHKANIIEWSPHFHNSKCNDFLNNTKLLDIHIGKNKSANQLKKLKRTNLGGYIYIQNYKKNSEKVINFVKRNSINISEDLIDTSKRKYFFKKYAFTKKDLSILYFKTKTKRDLLKITNYLEKNKNLIT